MSQATQGSWTEIANAASAAWLTGAWQLSRRASCRLPDAGLQLTCSCHGLDMKLVVVVVVWSAIRFPMARQ